MSTQDRWWSATRLAWIAAGAVTGLTAAAAAAGVALARKAVTPDVEPDFPVEVVRIERSDDDTVVWLRGNDSTLPGKYSLQFDHGNGHARIGRVLKRRGNEVARELLAVDRGQLVPGERGRINGWWYTDPEQLGLRTERIVYRTEVGEAEALLVHPKRAKKRRFAIHVHGRGALPTETFRGLEPLASAGITSIVIHYRNDPGAPAGDFGRYGVGIAESRDVDAAIAEAVSRGAERVTLFGWSMGGTASLVAATSGEHRAVIDGVILDSPVVDWAALLRYHAAALHAPRSIADLGIGLLERGIVRGGQAGGIAFDRLTPEAFGAALQVPVLIHASTGDTYVPCSGAQKLAAVRPDLVQLRLVAEAEHVRLWNLDQAGWDGATEQFAKALPRPAWRG